MSWYGGRGWCCLPGDLALLLPLLLFSNLSPLLPAHSHPSLNSSGGLGALRLWVVLCWQREVGCVVLAEFQTPIIFDQNCDFNRSTAYRHPKIVKIIICTFDIIEMYLQFFRSQLQLFNNAKGKVHSKQPKQAPDSFIAPPTGLLKSL